MFAALATVCHLYGDYLAGLAALVVASYWPADFTTMHGWEVDKSPPSIHEAGYKDSGSIPPPSHHTIDYYYRLRVGEIYYLAGRRKQVGFRSERVNFRHHLIEESTTYQLPIRTSAGIELNSTWADYVSEVCGTSLSAFLIIALLLLLMGVALSVPLPSELCDRKKVQLVEIGLRISNEHLGDLVESVAGARARNKLTRFICAIPFYFQGSPPKWCVVQNEQIAGVKCRIYLPQGERRKSDAAIIFIHGGGWCIMRPNYYDGPLISLIARVGCPVISIDYTLSPEARFPSAIEECERVFQEIYQKKYPDYGVNPKRIVLMGDSAGGNLCAVLSQRALRAGRPEMIKCQVLIYPVIHCLDMLSPSYRYYYEEYRGAALLNPPMLTRWLLMYVGVERVDSHAIRSVLSNSHSRPVLDEDVKKVLDHSLLPAATTAASSSPSLDSKRRRREDFVKRLDKTLQTGEIHEEVNSKLRPLLTNPDLCPLLGKDLQGLAPAMICTMGVDILRDEGILYARRLQEYGVPVRWHHYEAAFHGLLHMPMSKQRKQLFDDIASYLQEAL